MRVDSDSCLSYVLLVAGRAARGIQVNARQGVYVQRREAHASLDAALYVFLKHV